MTRPELVQQAWDYFRNVQTKDRKYIPFITKDDPPATHLNANILGEVSRADEEVLLRPDEVLDLSGAAGDQVPDDSDLGHPAGTVNERRNSSFYFPPPLAARRRPALAHSSATVR